MAPQSLVVPVEMFGSFSLIKPHRFKRHGNSALLHGHVGSEREREKARRG